MTLENRLKQIEAKLTGKKKLEACDMTDDELARLITGNPESRACDLDDETLAAIVREA